MDANHAANAEALKAALASYAGIAGLVVIAVGGIKAGWKTWIEGKEPIVAFTLTYALGVTAKLALPYYGPADFASWALHLVMLFFTALLGKQIHDGFVNPVVKGKG